MSLTMLGQVTLQSSDYTSPNLFFFTLHETLQVCNWDQNSGRVRRWVWYECWGPYTGLWHHGWPDPVQYGYSYCPSAAVSVFSSTGCLMDGSDRYSRCTVALALTSAKHLRALDVTGSW